MDSNMQMLGRNLPKTHQFQFQTIANVATALNKNFLNKFNKKGNEPPKKHEMLSQKREKSDYDSFVDYLDDEINENFEENTRTTTKVKIKVNCSCSGRVSSEICRHNAQKQDDADKLVQRVEEMAAMKAQIMEDQAREDPQQFFESLFKKKIEDYKHGTSKQNSLSQAQIENKTLQEKLKKQVEEMIELKKQKSILSAVGGQDNTSKSNVSRNNKETDTFSESMSRKLKSPTKKAQNDQSSYRPKSSMDPNLQQKFSTAMDGKIKNQTMMNLSQRSFNPQQSNSNSNQASSFIKTNQNDHEKLVPPHSPHLKSVGLAVISGNKLMAQHALELNPHLDHQTKYKSFNNPKALSQISFNPESKNNSNVNKMRQSLMDFSKKQLSKQEKQLLSPKKRQRKMSTTSNLQLNVSRLSRDPETPKIKLTQPDKSVLNLSHNDDPNSDSFSSDNDNDNSVRNSDMELKYPSGLTQNISQQNTNRMSLFHKQRSNEKKNSNEIENHNHNYNQNDQFSRNNNNNYDGQNNYSYALSQSNQNDRQKPNQTSGFFPANKYDDRNHAPLPPSRNNGLNSKKNSNENHKYQSHGHKNHHSISNQNYNQDNHYYQSSSRHNLNPNNGNHSHVRRGSHQNQSGHLLGQYQSPPQYQSSSQPYSTVLSSRLGLRSDQVEYDRWQQKEMQKQNYDNYFLQKYLNKQKASEYSHYRPTFNM
ncbi:UNKNOWN [Stylonychia lemnae]|uniref:Uncharacterized protein n=1 Tax=Stylonychia lemnae TaxID=5949 RepID=A0A078A9L0_STYLE|nr:UNKNOWN [Stylonychia lemnae]|eukprot:CDW77483.1 UNKNOWN [Stylonychia lemnae]